jgi:hypothetical protein
VLPDPCKHLLPLLGKNHSHLGDLSQPPNFFYLSHIHSHISGFISCHLYSFSTQILLLLAFSCYEVVPSPAGVPCLKLAFLLLLGSLLLLAFLLLLGCHKLVSGCMAHGHQFSADIQVQLLKLPFSVKVAVTTAIWHRWCPN